jgi:Tol biopolymer transport system component
MTRVMSANSNVTYVPPEYSGPGALLYYSGGALVSQPFDADAEKLLGEPKVVEDRVDYIAGSYYADFKVSANGRTLVIGAPRAGSRLRWFDRAGEEIGAVRAEGQMQQPRISPSGDRVAFSRPDDKTGNREVWTVELARGIVSRLTQGEGNNWYPVWSPDGGQLLFGSDREKGPRIRACLKTSIETGAEELLLHSTDEPYDWSRDGNWMALGGADITVTSAKPPYQSFTFLATKFREGGPRFSPDSKWLAYSSDESGKSEVYVRPFAGEPAKPEGKVQISTRGGGFPIWGKDSREIFFMAGDLAIYAVDVRNLGRGGPIPLPARLFDPCPGTKALGSPLAAEPYQYNFDTQDGQRFLVNCRADPPGQYSVLLNWLGR